MNAEAQLRAAGAEVESARAGVARAEARLTQAEKDLARDAELYKGGILPRATAEAAQTERDTRRADLEVARAALAAAQSRSEAARTAVGQARANLAALEARVVEAGDGAKLARARLADARILSPVAAAVAYRGAEPGEVVSAGAAILTLVDTANLWVRLDLGQADAARVASGLPATVAVDGLTGRAFGGQVWDVAREGEFATQRDVTRGRQDIRTFRVRVRVADPTGTLRPGMTVRVSIPLGSAPH
jgi:HlyD family secretion protein